MAGKQLLQIFEINDNGNKDKVDIMSQRLLVLVRQKYSLQRGNLL